MLHVFIWIALLPTMGFGGIVPATGEFAVGKSRKAIGGRRIAGLLSLMSDAQQLRETEEFFHQQIPITRAMGVRVAAYDGRQFTLVAPIALNHNHLGTAFGGSLGAVATLAGYGLLWLELRDRACHVVIRRSSLSFRRPVRKDVVAICRRPDEEALRAFKAVFAQRGQARIGLDVTIQEDGLVAVEFQGLFVALK